MRASLSSLSVVPSFTAWVLVLLVTSCVSPSRKRPDGGGRHADAEVVDARAPRPDGASGLDASSSGPDGALPHDASFDAEVRVDSGSRVDAEVDAGSDAGPRPECTSDAECGSSRRCWEGSCRTPCLFGVYCAEGTASGEICHDGVCVECSSDAQCSGRERCDTRTRRCVDRPVDTGITKFGIFYSLWHCRAAARRPVLDITQILASGGATRPELWGDYREFHWWGQPEDGYYCLSSNDALLRKHAEQLRDAGIDFVFLDITNWNYVDPRSDDTPGLVIRPLDRLLAVWSAVPGAPRVVPWLPVVEAGTDPERFTVDAVLTRLARYPGMQFVYEGKPLLLVTVNSQYPVNASREAALARDYTIRRMWVFDVGSPQWSYQEHCRHAPTNRSEPCAQRTGMRGGEIEQIPVAFAYQMNYMNNAERSTPRHRGLTFRRQFETVLDHPETPIVTITGWNEWVVQRQPCTSDVTCPCSRYSTTGCFLDQYNLEYSRDAEPGRNEMGDYYYRLMTACIALHRSGGKCDAAHADDLCCRDYAR
jgi:hypothetical protein